MKGTTKPKIYGFIRYFWFGLKSNFEHSKLWMDFQALAIFLNFDINQKHFSYICVVHIYTFCSITNICKIFSYICLFFVILWWDRQYYLNCWRQHSAKSKFQTWNLLTKYNITSPAPHIINFRLIFLFINFTWSILKSNHTMARTNSMKLLVKWIWCHKIVLM